MNKARIQLVLFAFAMTIKHMSPEFGTTKQKIDVLLYRSQPVLSYVFCVHSICISFRFFFFRLLNRCIPHNKEKLINLQGK